MQHQLDIKPLNLHLGIFLGIFFSLFLLRFIPTFDLFAISTLALDTKSFLWKLHLWQIVTAIFLDTNPMSFFFHMVLLCFLGNELAHAWRPKEFIGYFLLCGISGMLCFQAIYFATAAKTLGPSGVIFGLLVAYAMVFGQRVVLLLFIIPLKAKYVVFLCFLVEVIFLQTSFAHLAGAVVGFLYIKRSWHETPKATPVKPAQTRLGALEL